MLECNTIIFSYNGVEGSAGYCRDLICSSYPDHRDYETPNITALYDRFPKLIHYELTLDASRTPINGELGLSKVLK